MTSKEKLWAIVSFIECIHVDCVVTGEDTGTIVIANLDVEVGLLEDEQLTDDDFDIIRKFLSLDLRQYLEIAPDVCTDIKHQYGEVLATDFRTGQINLNNITYDALQSALDDLNSRHSFHLKLYRASIIILENESVRFEIVGEPQ